MRRRRGADIDVTPLIDILFMLIIFFVLAASFLQGRLTVELPRGESAPGRAESSPVLVTLARDGSVSWGNFSMPAPVASADVLRLARESLFRIQGSGGEILVAADRGVPYGDVVGLLDVLRLAGIERLGLALQIFGAGENGGGSGRR
jgi:biopolymer transport protein ExbD